MFATKMKYYHTSIQHDNLDKEGLKLEIALRNVETLRKDGKDPKKDQMKTALKDEMRGIHRVPTLL